MHLQDHLKASFVRTGLVPDERDADLHVAGYEGRFVAKSGASTVVAFAAWLRSQAPEGVDRHDLDAIGFHDGARMTAYADLLASCASGAVDAPVDYGDQGAFPVVRDATPPRHDADAIDYRFDQFAEAAGRLMFAGAWASRMEENGEGSSLSGMRIEDVMPSVPREAVLEGATLAGMYEQAAGKGVWELYLDALRAHFGPDVDVDDVSEGREHGFERFAEALAFEAEGAGVSWEDDHAPFDHPKVHFEYVCEAGLPSPEDDEEDEDLDASPSP